MSQDHQHKLPDMNEVFRGIAQEVVNANVGNQLANALIASGNALRNQAFAMMSQIAAEQLLTKPALLEGGQSLCLLPFFRPIQNVFRLIASYSSTGERVIVVFIENEAETLKTGFYNLGDAQKAELNRELDAINFKNEGVASVELGLLIVEQPVEGYEYFKAEGAEEVIEVPAGAVKTDTPAPVAGEAPAAAPAVAPAPAPIPLDSVIGDVAPSA